MGETTFTPEVGDLYTGVALFGLAFLGLVLTAWYLGRRHTGDARLRILLPMLTYFVALLALMGMLGSFWAITKYPAVTVAGARLIIADQTYPIPTAGAVRFEAVSSAASFGGGGRLLLVQTKDYRNWAFPEERYPINEMYDLLRK